MAYSRDAVGKVFGDGWFERGYARGAACPLAFGPLDTEQLFGGYP